MTVGTIGVFDGVHVGHRALLAHARSLGSPLLAVTFDPHPRSVVGGSAPSSLATLDHRIELLRACGADDVHVLHFTPELAAMPAAEFVQDVLVGELGLRMVVVGQNFRFGAGARGDVGTIADVGAPLGLAVEPVGLVGDTHGRWSSTRIRALIEHGDVSEAALGLMRPYRLFGPVVHGAHRGRELGYPTANIATTDHPTIPADGVYAGLLDAGHGPWPAAISVGTNPQFGGEQRTVEAYALDIDQDLYDRQARVDFLQRLRGQRTFASVADLQAQMARDVAQVRQSLGA